MALLHVKLTLSRIAKSTPDFPSLSKPSGAVAFGGDAASNHPKKVTRWVSKNDLRRWRPHLHNYQTQVYQNFLRPLNIENLKVYNEVKHFDSQKARLNWQRQQSMLAKQQFKNYLDEKTRYESVVQTMIKGTPNHLKGIADLPSRVAAALAEHEQNRGPHTQQLFEELPKMPQAFTSETFRDYISSLCRTTYHYRNLLSLLLGLVPDILLWTHDLSNPKFRPYRLVHTYNELIYWFGRKNQSLFARQLLLVMTHDGHSPNTDTINHLLRLAANHSHGRATTSTLSILKRSIGFAVHMGIPLNLDTYARVYDATTNIFLREYLLAQMNAAGIPLTPGLVLRIVDDYAKTTTNTNDLIRFIEHDLKRTNWQQENGLFNKVIFHKSLHQPHHLPQLLEGVTPDSYTLKLIIEGINDRQGVKASMMLYWYFKMTETTPAMHPYIYAKLINAVNQEGENIIPTAMVIINGLLSDMKLAFNCSSETTTLLNVLGKPMFNIAAKVRVLGRDLNETTESESRQWQLLRQHYNELGDQPIELPKALANVIEVTEGSVSSKPVKQQMHIHQTRGLAARDRIRIQKAQEGLHAYTERSLIERGLLNHS